MTVSVDSKAVLQIIKTLMKNRKLSYRMVAKRVGMSESGLKKIFASHDCSFNRLSSLCEAMEVQLQDVLASLASTRVKEIQFTARQEAFFLADQDAFPLFWKLVYERIPLHQIQEELDLSHAALFKKLRKLDQLGLIELHPGDRIKLPKMELAKWMGNGPHLRRIRKEWSSQLIHEVLEEEKISDERHFSMRFYRLTPESAQELINTIRDLDLEFGRRYLREVQLYPGRLKPVRMISCIAPGRYAEKTKARRA